MGLRRFLPPNMYENRFAGESFPTFEAFLSRVRLIASDRCMASLREESQANKRPKMQAGSDPMDIGYMGAKINQAVKESGEDIDEETMGEICQVLQRRREGWRGNFGSKPKGNGKQSSGSWNREDGWYAKGKGDSSTGWSHWGNSPGDLQPTPKGGSPKGGKKGNEKKGNGKGKGCCFNCGGMGHIARNCPSPKGAGKGLNEVTDYGDGQENDEAKQYEESEDFNDATAFELEHATEVTHQSKALASDQASERIVFMQQLPQCQSSRATVPVRNRFGPLSESELSLMDYQEPGESDVADLLEVSKMTATGMWVKLTGTVDSGCVDHVVPKDCLPGVKLEPSQMSKAGKGYRSATSQGIPNLGQKHLKAKTREGHKKTVVVQVADVTKPLISTARLNETGHDVNLTADDPHIYHKKTGQRTKLRRVGRACVLDLWIWVGSEEQKKPKKGDDEMEVDSDFSRRR